MDRDIWFDAVCHVAEGLSTEELLLVPGVFKLISQHVWVEAQNYILERQGEFVYER